MAHPKELVLTAVNALYKRWYAKTPRTAQTVADVSLIAGMMLGLAAPYIAIPGWVIASASLTVWVVSNLQTEQPVNNQNKEELK